MNTERKRVLFLTDIDSETAKTLSSEYKNLIIFTNNGDLSTHNHNDIYNNGRLLTPIADVNKDLYRFNINGDDVELVKTNNRTLLLNKYEMILNTNASRSHGYNKISNNYYELSVNDETSCLHFNPRSKLHSNSNITTFVCEILQNVNAITPTNNVTDNGIIKVTKNNSGSFDVKLNTTTKHGRQLVGMSLLRFYNDDVEMYMVIKTVLNDFDSPKIVLDTRSMAIYKNQRKQIHAIINPAEYKYHKIIWKSNNSSIVSVDGNGVIHSHTSGATKIIASLAVNENVKAECVVNVIGGEQNVITHTNISQVFEADFETQITAATLNNKARMIDAEIEAQIHP